MVDHVRTLLLNSDGVQGYRRVVDGPADSVLALFGVTNDADSVDRVLPLAMAPDLACFRRFFDSRTIPSAPGSIYSQTDSTLSVAGLRNRVLSGSGWWVVLTLFNSSDAAVADVLRDMRAAAASNDAPYALGAVLLACAYRRWVLQRGGDA